MQLSQILNEQINEWKNTYPAYHNKMNKVIWRGQLTGYMSKKNITQRGIRYHLLKYVHDTNILSKDEFNLYDIKLISENDEDYLNTK